MAIFSKNFNFKTDNIKKNSFKSFLCFILILLQISTFNIHCLAANISVNSEAAIILELNSNEILYSKNMHQKMYPASLTKFLTGLLAIEYGNIDDTIVFNKEATTLEPGSSTLNFTAGEEIELNHALYGLMLKSANEIGNQLAYYIKEKSGLNYPEAASKKLNEIGAVETNFTSPTGLHEDNHYTSAYDLSLIAKSAYENETFRNYFSTLSYTIPATNKSDERTVYNTHKMLSSSSNYHLDSIIGGKTGTTSEAGNTLITFAKQDEMLIVVVVLKADGISMACEDTYNLINYAFKNFETKKLISNDDIYKELSAVNNYDVEEGVVPVRGSKDFYITYSKNDSAYFENDIPDNFESEFVTFSASIPKKIVNSISAGHSIGELSITTNSGYNDTAYLISDIDFKFHKDQSIDFNKLFTYIFYIALLSLIIFVAFFVKLCLDEKKFDEVEEGNINASSKK